MLSDFSEYYIDLTAALAPAGSSEEADTPVICRWRVTYGEVESYVATADELLRKFEGFQSAFEW